MNNTIKIEDKREMIGFLRTIGTGCSFVSLKTETAVRMRKTGNPFLGAVKVAHRTGLINVDFVKSVRRRLSEITGEPLKDTEYEAGTTWYKHVETEEGKPLPLCVHQKDERKFYLQFFPLKNHGNTYFHNGRQLTAEGVKELETFVYEQERVEFKPIVITLAIDSIRQMKARSITLLNETVNRIAQRFNEPAQKRISKSKDLGS